MQQPNNKQLELTIVTSPAGLTIHWLAMPIGGHIGLTRCPGVSGQLGEDVKWLAAQDAKLVLSLISCAELRDLGLTNLGPLVIDAGMSWQHLPIADMQAPPPEFEKRWPAVCNCLKSRLAGGESIVIHCLAGRGRAGTVASALLVACGREPLQAIADIRLARPGAVETAAQESWVLAQNPT